MNIGEYCPEQYIILYEHTSCNMIHCEGQYSPIFMQYPFYYIVINISSSEVLLILSRYDFFIYHYYIALGRIF